MKRLALAAAVLAAGSATVLAPGSAEAAITATACSSNVPGQHCLGPATLTLSSALPYCEPFSDGYEWQTYVDRNGVKQLWTYSNGSNACVQVNYTPYNTSATCTFKFYVPYDGYADADITFGWWDGSNTKHTVTINEATSPASGWVTVFSAPNVRHISFQDNNGQTPGAYYLGWGDSAAFGFWQDCG